MGTRIPDPAPDQLELSEPSAPAAGPAQARPDEAAVIPRLLLSHISSL